MEWDLGGSGGRATQTKSPSDQRVTDECNSTQRIADIQGAEVVGDERITKKQKVADEEHKKVPVVKWADEQHQRELKQERKQKISESGVYVVKEGSRM